VIETQVSHSAAIREIIMATKESMIQYDLLDNTMWKIQTSVLISLYGI